MQAARKAPFGNRFLEYSSSRAVGMWESRSDFQARRESLRDFRRASLCAVHVRPFEGESPLSNLMAVKD